MKCSICDGYLKNGVCRTCGWKIPQQQKDSVKQLSRPPEFHLMPHEIKQFSSTNEIYHDILQKNAEHHTLMLRKYGNIYKKHLETCKFYFEALEPKTDKEFIKQCIELCPDIIKCLNNNIINDEKEVLK